MDKVREVDGAMKSENPPEVVATAEVDRVD